MALEKIVKEDGTCEPLAEPICPYAVGSIVGLYFCEKREEIQTDTVGPNTIKCEHRRKYGRELFCKKHSKF